MEMELQSAKQLRTQKSRGEKRWIAVFNHLAGIQHGDQEELEIGLTTGSSTGAIDLSKLKSYLRTESSKKVKISNFGDIL